MVRAVSRIACRTVSNLNVVNEMRLPVLVMCNSALPNRVGAGGLSNRCQTVEENILISISTPLRLPNHFLFALLILARRVMAHFDLVPYLLVM